MASRPEPTHFVLKLLRAQVALVEKHSTVRAGRRLFLSQSAIFGALAQSRGAFGDPLLNLTAAPAFRLDWHRRLSQAINTMPEICRTHKYLGNQREPTAFRKWRKADAHARNSHRS